MKIIDILVKIANGEEVPKKIKVHDTEYYKCILKTGIDYKIYSDDFYYLSNDICKAGFSLNDEVEILEEEKKIPEKLEDISEIKCVGCKVEINIAGNKTLFDTDTPIVTEHCIYKINQLIKNQKKIIDYLKSKGDE